MGDQSERTQVLKSQAVRQAVFEILGENREEVVKRARAKLVAMGVEFSEDDALAAAILAAAPAETHQSHSPEAK
jgi:ferritin-like metal-binding protein YciE